MAPTTSTLSELTRTPTPPSNESHYLTASEGTSGSASVTEPSSPAGDSRDDLSRPKAVYRDAVTLPRELKLRCHIHLEEQYYTAALNLLNSLLCDGIPPAAHAQTNHPGCVAPPAQMAVLATLAIHPKHTSKLPSSAAHDVSSLALSYLRTVLATVGPVNANLRDAFLFRGDSGRGSRRRSSENAAAGGLGGDVESDEDLVRGKTANKGSIWVRGQDFWRVLGWAFNCSAQHPHRWRWWQPWLEYMVDVLEADYKERKRLDLEREGCQDEYEYQLLQESLLVSYVVPKNSRVSALKPIISALFADGNTSSQAIFKEVFTRENKVASKTSKKRKRDRVDLENDKFGDYDDDSSTGGSEPPTPEHLRVLAMDVKNDTALWSGSSLLDTIPLRLRLFALLSEAACDLPRTCVISLPDLYEKTTERISQLPVVAFSKFLAQHDTPLSKDSLVAIIRCLMPYLLPGTAPRPSDADPEVDAREDISTRIMERCYLPFAYRTAENNAKLSLALEALLRLDFCSWSPTLQHAVEKGVAARNDKGAPRKGGRFRTDGELAAQDMLRASGKRLLAWVEILKMEHEMECDDEE
ncbi:hypothetical protein KVR01_008659 [Diaporthe batatas]|uniref:uncharacterized protein n=1 Tax=Diaporthe batatas TaxID=748121 RepID=UPI001D0466E0|nr:uncharacterized protein KVR01_008659 [Diaporthe batatas]KAG8161672.1 hypothetical protein KVR01_008659 [Diaporthe batatas]